MINELPPRLTVEEVNEFNPTVDNPLIVKCDDGNFTRELSEIKIISRSVNGRFSIIDRDGDLTIINEKNLCHYPSQEKPNTKMVQFYQAIAHSTYNGQLTIGNVLITKNYKLSDGSLLRGGEKILKLIPVCELEMPFDFEE